MSDVEIVRGYMAGSAENDSAATPGGRDALAALDHIERELLAARDVVEASRAVLALVDEGGRKRRWWDLGWLQTLRATLSTYDETITGG